MDSDAARILLLLLGRFTPADLFASGAQGAFYDPSDFSTLFQDAAGTVPVTAVEQPVRLMRDKSGRGNHATAPSDAARPTLRADSNGRLHLAFDGVNDSMSTASVDFSATDKATVFAGVTKLSDALAGMVVELSPNFAANNGSFFLAAPGANGATTVTWVSKGTLFAIGETSGLAAPITRVVTAQGDISGDSAILRANGVQVASSASDQGTGNFGNHALFIGARNNTDTRLNGRLYGLTVLGRTATAQEIAATEAWLNARTGADFSPPPPPVTAEYLLVAGGGGGGTGAAGLGVAGGGGAGGLLSGSASIAVGSYPVTVGAGGGGGLSSNGTSGSNSVWNGFTAVGGGFGAAGNSLSAGTGGSGGGGGFNAAAGGSGTAGQGNAGSTWNGSKAGGGGGAGEAGGTDTAGEGGDGLASSITGTSVTYAGGGGSGETATGSPGGDGGGGAGQPSGTPGTAGTANRGGGGGATGDLGANAGGNGGSGVVIIRYTTGTMLATGGTITTSGPWTIHTFNSSGTFERTL